MFTNTFSLHLINYSFCDKLPYIKATQQLREMVHSVATNKYLWSNLNVLNALCEVQFCPHNSKVKNNDVSEHFFLTKKKKDVEI